MKVNIYLECEGKKQITVFKMLINTTSILKSEK